MKTLLLLLAMLITSSTVFSQLYVQPNPTSTTDSYIYVDDEILFVEQDVNLKKNVNDLTTVASIYLRNEAQLIQGTTSSDNDGDGQISVYQNAPDSDRWTYNYWCSPVGNETIVGSGNKNFGLFRIYDIQGLTDSNVTLRTTGRDGSKTEDGLNGTAPNLTISSRWMYTHPRGTEAEGSYVRMDAGDNATAGEGFLMKGVDSNPVGGAGGTGFEYDFRGRANNGNIDVDVFNTELTLTGNPYPSTLDLNRVFWEPGNSEIDEFHYWDEDKDSNSHYYYQNKGGYGTFAPGAPDPNGYNGSSGFVPGVYAPPTYSVWNSSGGSTSTGDPGVHYERRFAPIGQGFMIKAGSTGIITIKNSHRRYIKEGVGNNSVFGRPGLGINVDPIDPDPIPDPIDPDPIPDPDPLPVPIDNRLPQLRINTSFGTSHIRQMVLSFSEDCTDGFDRGFDATHPMDAGGGEIYFPIIRNGEQDEYVIQGIDFRIYKQIPVNFTLNNNYSITVEVIEKINFSQEAYLLDRYNRSYTQITSGYKAEFNLDSGDHTRRFAIVFINNQNRENPDGEITAEEMSANVDFFQNNPQTQLEVSNPEGYDIKSATIYDMTGKLVATKNNVGAVANFTISTSNLSDGVYLVKLTTSENIDIDYKTIIRNN